MMENKNEKLDLDKIRYNLEFRMKIFSICCLIPVIIIFGYILYQLLFK